MNKLFIIEKYIYLLKFINDILKDFYISFSY